LLAFGVSSGVGLLVEVEEFRMADFGWRNEELEEFRMADFGMKMWR